MNKIYLIYGDERYLIEKKINEIISENSDYDVIKYDMTIDNIKDAIEDALMGSLFSEKKIIICDNCLFLTTLKCEIDHKVEYLNDYIKKDSDNILILVVNNESLDKRKKIVKDLEKFNVFYFNKLNNNELVNFVKNYCQENHFEISSSAINLLLERVVDNLYIIVSELNKLFLYCDGKINLEDVSLCTSKMIKCNIFDLINAIVARNIDLSLELYDDLVILNEEEIKLIITLANQFRLIYQVKCMFKSGYSEKDIASELGVHPYRVKLANSVNTDERTILNYLKRLSILDENIKTGKINKREGFINFILSI